MKRELLTRLRLHIRSFRSADQQNHQSVTHAVLRSLTLVFAASLSLSAVVIGTVISLTLLQEERADMRAAEELLAATLSDNLQFFELATAQSYLERFSQTISANRIRLVDRYGTTRAETGNTSNVSEPDRSIAIYTRFGIEIGHLEFWHSEKQGLTAAILKSTGVFFVFLVGALEALRRSVILVVNNNVLHPLSLLKQLIELTPNSENEWKLGNLELEDKNEFKVILEEYEDVYRSLRGVSHEKDQLNDLLQKQRDLLLQVMRESEIAVWQLDRNWNETESATGALPPRPIVDAIMSDLRKAKAVEQLNHRGNLRIESLAGNSPSENQRKQEFRLNAIEQENTSWSVTYLELPDQGTSVLARNVSQLQHLESELRAAQKMESLGILAAGISHDFNNLLAVILGSLELLNDSPRLSASDQKYIDSALRAVNNSSEIIKNLLAYGRQSPSSSELVSPAELINDVQQLITSGERPGMKYEFCKLTDKQLYLDRDSLVSSMLNLLLNACHAMMNTGLVKIFYRDASDEEAEPLGKASVAITVQDSGPGIPDHLIASVCDPFFTAKRTGEGSGLGLSMVAGFAEQFGGYFSITNSKPGVLAKIILPAAESFENKDKASNPKVRIADFQRLSVLLADDNVELLKIYAKHIKTLGHAAHCARTIDEATSLILTHKNQFDALITDLNFPDGLGTEILEVFHQANPLAKTVLISGRTTQSDLSSRFDWNVQKPVTMMDLANILSSSAKNTRTDV